MEILHKHHRIPPLYSGSKIALRSLSLQGSEEKEAPCISDDQLLHKVDAKRTACVVEDQMALHPKNTPRVAIVHTCTYLLLACANAFHFTRSQLIAP